MLLDENSSRPQIKYPCKWEYKIIGTDVDSILKAIEEASYGIKYEVKPSNVSKKGKYFSLNLRLEVPSEVVRNLIFEKLENHSAVKMVL